MTTKTEPPDSDGKEPPDDAPVLTWEDITGLPPSDCAEHLTALGKSAQGSPRVLRERLGKALGVFEAPGQDLPSVFAAITAVKAAIGAVGKDAKITSGPAQYNYRGIDAILEAAHPALVAHGVVIVPDDAHAVYESRTTNKGGALQWVSLTVTWRIYGPAGDAIGATTVGEALDTSDKATNKAHTAAHKLILSELFAIPFAADDQDADRHELGAPSQQIDTAGLSARVQALQDRLENLPSELYEKAIVRMTERANKSGSEITRFDSVDMLGEGSVLVGWLDAWERTLSAAWKAADTTEAPDDSA